MTGVLKNVALSFLRAFGASALTYAFGILEAPNLDQAYVLAAAAVVGSLVAGFRTIQEFVPMLSFVSYVPEPFAGYLDSFSRAFLGSLIASLTGINAVPELSGVRSLVTAAIIGALSAGIKALHTVAPTPPPPIQVN